MMEGKKNTLGIVGICVGAFIPLVGIVLGIISLAKKEKSIAIGILSIVMGAVGWIVIWFLFVVFLGFTYGISNI